MAALLAHKHDFGMRGTVAENGLRAGAQNVRKRSQALQFWQSAATTQAWDS